jgi:PadR family transcriptional regulator, regulatory protein PadR
MVTGVGKSKVTRIRSSKQTVALLAALSRKPAEWHYGYALSRETGLQSGTLYPILMRLEERGWLETQWEAPPPGGRPPRHMYRLTSSGRASAVEAISAARASGALRLALQRG